MAAISEQSAPSSETFPSFCFYCGYNLSGLELPRNCPECGRSADPPRQAEQAAAWFASRRVLTWFLRPRAVPPGVIYVLRTADQRRIARRRTALLLWLPAIACLLAVLVGSSFNVELSLVARYYDQNKPGTPLIHLNRFTRVEEPFASNLHLFEEGLFFRPPANWKRVVTVEARHVRFGGRPSLTKTATISALMPLAVLVGVYYGVGWLLRLWPPLQAQRAASVSRHSITTAWSLMSPFYAVGMWAWLVAVLGDVTTELFAVRFEMLVLPPALVAAVTWLIAALIAPLTFSRFDAGRLAISGSKLVVPLATLAGAGVLLLMLCGGRLL